jgi:4'-phosphopantetheinyl transferase
VAVSVWIVHPSEVPADRLEALSSWLLPEEHAKRARFVTPELRREYLLTRALARWALSRAHRDVAETDWVFARTEAGRPFVSGVRAGLRPERFPDFNLSNTPRLVACAVSSSTVRLDVEAENRFDSVLEVASIVFSDRENADLAALDIAARRGRCVELWALKESYVKLLGDGISAPLREITFVQRDGSWRVDGVNDVAFFLTHVAGHALAVASRGDALDCNVTLEETAFARSDRS